MALRAATLTAWRSSVRQGSASLDEHLEALLGGWAAT